MTEEKKGSEKGALDLFKKLLNSGVGAALLTEDLIKSTLPDISLPKELLERITNNARHTKEEVLERGSGVLKELIQKVDWRKEVSTFLSENELDVQFKVRFKKRK